MQVYEFLDRGAFLNPRGQAFVAADGSGALTYEETVALTHRIALGLQKHGLEEGTPVAVLSQNSPIVFPFVLGVMRAGCAWVALNARSSALDLASLLEVVGARALLYANDMATEATTIASSTSCLESCAPIEEVLDSWIAPEGSEARPLALAPEGTAAYFGTGGTTGRPKAVSVPHRAFDMGGTTAKSAVIRDLTMPLASDYFLGGYLTGLPIRIPCIDIVEVGTGGGSIAWLDSAGGVHLGPQSAGADPGPACYGRGGEHPTITDATVVLGQLRPGGSLFGGLKLDAEAASAAIDRVGKRLGLDRIAMSAGIIDMGAAAMANSVRAVTTQRGLDPRDFALFAYGGNGPLHISLVARELGISRVIVPPMPSVFSALGMLMADVRLDLVQTKVRPIPSASEEWEADFAELERLCEKELVASALEFDFVTFERAADMRYVGQEHTVTARVPRELVSLKSLFDAEHQARYSHSAPDQPAEIVSLRASAIGRLSPLSLDELRPGGEHPPAEAEQGSRPIVFDPRRGWVETPVFNRQLLLSGNKVVGPAVIEEASATTLLRPGDIAEVDPLGNLVVSIGGRL